MIEIKLNNHNHQCKVLNDVWYHIDTPNKVIEILDDAINRRYRIRLFYGDKITGEDYKQTYETIGYIGKCTGNFKEALLIPRSTSTGGYIILTDTILKITINKNIMYQHPKYNIDISNEEPTMADFLLGKRNNYAIKSWR